MILGSLDLNSLLFEQGEKYLLYPVLLSPWMESQCWCKEKTLQIKQYTVEKG